MTTHDRSTKKQVDVSPPKTSLEEQAPDNASGLASFYAIQGAIQKPSRETLTPRAILQLQRTIGNQAVLRMLAGVSSDRVQRLSNSSLVASVQTNTPVIQRVVGESVLWDAYFAAYDAKMSKANIGRRDVQWQTWLQAFHRLEEALYEAKKPLPAYNYNSDEVQTRYDRLIHLGLTPPDAEPDPLVAAANTILHDARVRFNAFRGNNGLNRGAWAGSATHGGQPNDYVQTPNAVIDRLRAKNLGNWWLMQSDSAPSGNALHRGAVDNRGDFIYHL
jgi:hypothetical protein